MASGPGSALTPPCVSRWGLALLAALAACGGVEARAGDGDADAGLPYLEGGILADRLCPDDSFLSYQNFGAGFFAAYCAGCHSAQIPEAMRQMAPPGVNFDAVAGIEANRDAIYLRAADGYAIMPPAGGPTAQARVLLGEWLACGMR